MEYSCFCVMKLPVSQSVNKLDVLWLFETDDEWIEQGARVTSSMAIGNEVYINFELRDSLSYELVDNIVDNLDLKDFVIYCENPYSREWGLHTWTDGGIVISKNFEFPKITSLEKIDELVGKYAEKYPLVEFVGYKEDDFSEAGRLEYYQRYIDNVFSKMTIEDKLGISNLMSKHIGSMKRWKGDYLENPFLRPAFIPSESEQDDDEQDDDAI